MLEFAVGNLRQAGRFASILLNPTLAITPRFTLPLSFPSTFSFALSFRLRRAATFDDTLSFGSIDIDSWKFEVKDSICYLNLGSAVHEIDCLSAPRCNEYGRERYLPFEKKRFLTFPSPVSFDHDSIPSENFKDPSSEFVVVK